MSPIIISAIHDSLILAGAALVTYGFWSVYSPLGYVVGGALLLVAGLTGAMRSE